VPHATATAHELAVSGTTTAYWVYGDPDAARTLVAVHGFRGDHHGLELVAQRIVERDPAVRVVAPDLPGFGASAPLAGEHSVTGYGAWLGAFVDALGLDAPDVLGHSFGSIVTSHAVAGGLPVRRLVLANPIGAPALSGPRGVLTQLAVFYYWAGSRLPERLGFALLKTRIVTRIMSVTMAKTRDRTLRRWIHDQHDRYFGAFADRGVVLQAFRASVSHDVREVARGIRVPTLLVAATLDDITPIEAQRELVREFPDARLVELDGVGHLVHYERPDETAAAAVAFLGDERGADAS
jgi:pimeloyl-ACP methyl ester carboxylesterase